jgi:hypothetical protein
MYPYNPRGYNKYFFIPYIPLGIYAPRRSQEHEENTVLDIYSYMGANSRPWVL